jgi:hypothetical protein
MHSPQQTPTLSGICNVALIAIPNSLADGLWYFELSFYSHTQQHILDLLNYMKQKNG